MSSPRIATALALALATGCTCGAGDAAPAPTATVEPSRSPEPTLAPAPSAALPAGCLPEACLAAIDRVAAPWVVADLLDLPDPDSASWSDAADRDAYLTAAGLHASDVPPACQGDGDRCTVSWEMHVAGVAHPDGACPRARVALQLVLSDTETGDELRLGAPRVVESDFTGDEDLDAHECDVQLAAAAEAPHDAGPAPPTSPPTAPMRCVDLGPSIAVFAGTLDGVLLTLERQAAGPVVEGMRRLPATFELEPADLDGDGTMEGIATVVDVDPDGRRSPDCGSYGECNAGAVVRCDEGWAMVLVPDYGYGLAVGTTRIEHAGRSWRILEETTRLAGDMEEEAERIDEGRPLTSTTALVMGPAGYTSAGSAVWLESGRCAASFRAGRLAEARAMCEQGLAAHPRGPVRGALYFDLGRIAESEGRIADARDAYQRSLDARPSPVVRARLDALPPP